MLELFMVVIISGLCLWMMYGLAKYHQLHKFSAYMRLSINELYGSEKYKTTAIDIDKSYDNLMKAPAWNYKFDEMIIYANRS